MAKLTVRVPDDLVARFDAWAQSRGGRAAAVRYLVQQATRSVSAEGSVRLPPRPMKLLVSLTTEDSRGLIGEATQMGLTPSGWAAAVIRSRLTGRPTFRRADELCLIAIQAELRRIRINVNHIATIIGMAGLDENASELAHLKMLRAEICAHVTALGEAFDGNLAYWQGRDR